MYPISAKDQSRIHQFGKKVFPGLFFGYALYAGRIWKGDILVADVGEKESMDEAEIYAKRLDAKEVLTPMKGDNFIFPVADGTVEVSGGDRRLRPPTLIWIVLNEERNKKFFEENQTDSIFQPLFKMTQHGLMRKPKMTSGLLREISFIAITWNFESNCTCREKNLFLFPEVHRRCQNHSYVT